MMKTMTADSVAELLKEERGIHFDEYGYSEGKTAGRRIRILSMVIQVSEHEESFCRWSNSVEFELEYTRWKKKRLLREIDLIFQPNILSIGKQPG